MFQSKHEIFTLELMLESLLQSALEQLVLSTFYIVI